MSTPAHYTLTRKKTSKPDSAMRIILTGPEPEPSEPGQPEPDAGLGIGGTYFFMPGESHAIPGHAAAAFMADEYHADHFDIDPALPARAVKAAAKADAERVVVEEPPAPIVPAKDSTGVASKAKDRDTGRK